MITFKTSFGFGQALKQAIANFLMVAQKNEFESEGILRPAFINILNTWNSSFGLLYYENLFQNQMFFSHWLTEMSTKYWNTLCSTKRMLTKRRKACKHLKRKPKKRGVRMLRTLLLSMLSFESANNVFTNIWIGYHPIVYVVAEIFALKIHQNIQFSVSSTWNTTSSDFANLLSDSVESDFPTESGYKLQI